MHDTSPSVLIVRLDGIGDALALTPLVAALRARGCRIGMVASHRNAHAFAPGAIEHVYVARDSRIREPLSERYTHALIATEKVDGYRLAAALRIPTRIGFENGWGKPFKTLWVRALCTRTIRRTAGLDRRAPHEAEVLFELGRAILGESAQPIRDVRALRPLVVAAEPSAQSEYVALQVTGKWQRLGADIGELAEFVQRLNTGLPLRAVAASSEDAFADAFARRAGVNVERFDNLDPWKSVLANARVVIAPDSAAVHVAGMTGAPVVAVFPDTPDYALQAARWAPWAAPYRLVKVDGNWPTVAADAAGELLTGSAATYTG